MMTVQPGDQAIRWKSSTLFRGVTATPSARSRDLPAADGSQLGGADDSVGSYDSKPGKSPRLLDRERRENEGNLAGRDPQVPSDGPVGGDPAFGDVGQNRQDPRLEARYTT